jgi:hypothetical protein
LYNFKWCFYNNLNRLKWIRNKKVMRFESRRGSKKEKKQKKNMFCKLESLFFFLLFFHYSFSFKFQRWILKFEVTLHNILNHSKWNTYDEDINNWWICILIKLQIVIYSHNIIEQYYFSSGALGDILTISMGIIIEN